jgi:hypothetical protein
MSITNNIPIPLTYFEDTDILTADAGTQIYLMGDLSPIKTIFSLNGCYEAGAMFSDILKKCHGEDDHERSCCYFYFKSKRSAKKFIAMMNEKISVSASVLTDPDERAMRILRA